MSPEEVAQFLKANPEFFGERPDLLESLLVPHPHGGRAIPLVERQMVSLREKLKGLEGKLAEAKSKKDTLKARAASARVTGQRASRTSTAIAGRILVQPLSRACASILCNASDFKSLGCQIQPGNFGAI